MYVWLGILVLLGYTVLFQIVAFLFLMWFGGELRELDKSTRACFCALLWLSLSFLHGSGQVAA